MTVQAPDRPLGQATANTADIRLPCTRCSHARYLHGQAQYCIAFGGTWCDCTGFVEALRS